MDINSNSNISSLISSPISKLNLSTASRAFENTKTQLEESVQSSEDVKKDDISLIEDTKIRNKIDVDEIKKYAEIMGEKLTVDDINYGIMYGRSVIADYSA